jgi:hypothetical protein
MKTLLKINRMSKHSILCLFLLFAVNLAAKDIVIENPAYEFNTSGIFDISRIELGENETRIYVHTTFLPGWWVRFGEKDYIEDCATGKRWFVTKIINGEFEKEIPMPASGDSTFILVFPKIDRSVVKIDYKEDTIEGNTSKIYGISLDPKVKRRSAASPVPSEVKNWIDGELAKAKRKTLMNFDAGEFFSNDTARLIGYIKGYDKRAEFSSGIVYMGDAITEQDSPRVARIFSDGRFECLLPVKYPQMQTVSFQNQRIDFYIQPGTTLSMILDWEEFRKADRLKNIRYKFSDIQFDGAMAEVNKELTAFYAKLEDPQDNIYKEMSKKLPDEYKTYLDESMSKYAEACHQATSDKNMTALAKSLIQNNYTVEYAHYMMVYAITYSMNTMNYEKQEEKRKQLPVEFCGFLKDVPVNSPQILTSKNFSFSIINILTFSHVFAGRHRLQKPEKSFKQYLYEELGLQQTPEDTKYFSDMDFLSWRLQLNDITSDEQQMLIAEISEMNRMFNERYRQQLGDYLKKYQLSNYDKTVREWKIIDSIYTNVLKLKPGVVSDVMKTRELKFLFGRTLKDDKESAEKILAYLKKSLHEDFLKQESEQIFDRCFSPDRQKAYELPDTEDALAFEKIISPFRGKYVLVHLCATEMLNQSSYIQERYKDSEDVVHVFVTSEKDSPSQYEQLVKEQKLSNSFRVSELEYHYFQQLFAFSYGQNSVIVDREGRILNKNTDMHSAENYLEKLLENEK